MKKFIIMFMCMFMCMNISAQSTQKVYSDTVYSNGKIIINNYIINDKEEKVSVAEPIIFALDLFLMNHPYYDYRFPHYGWYRSYPVYRPVVIHRPPIYRPYNIGPRPMGPRPIGPMYHRGFPRNPMNHGGFNGGNIRPGGFNGGRYRR